MKNIRVSAYADEASATPPLRMGIFTVTGGTVLESWKMKKAGAFAKLPSVQRQVCIDSFRKFANMTPEQQLQFLKNAERWQAMTPSERETWRTLVTKLPPLPPGFGVPQLPPASSLTNR